MHRYLLYLASALLAFGLGVLIFKFYRAAGEKPAMAEEKQVTAAPRSDKIVGTGFATNFRSGNAQTDVPGYVPKLYKPNCSDKNLLPIWNELRKDKEFRESAKDFYMDANCSKMLEVQKLDLNNDGQKEFVLWGKNSNLCGGTGNCTLWIYERKNGRYKKLLQSVAYNDETKWFEVKKAESNGYRNLLLKTHYSGYETVYEFYKFNGSKYVENKCLFYEYMVNIKEPFVMTCKENLERSEKALRESQVKLKNQ